MNVSGILRPWPDDDVAVLAHCVSVGATPDDGSTVLGISIREYRDAVAVFDLRRKPPMPGERRCLSCEVRFLSADTGALRICDPCKSTDTWSYAGWLS